MILYFVKKMFGDEEKEAFTVKAKNVKTALKKAQEFYFRKYNYKADIEDFKIFDYMYI